MRFVKFITAIVLSASLILFLCLSAHAAAEEGSMYVYGLNCLYKPPAGSGLNTRERLYVDNPTSSGVYNFSIAGSIMEEQTEFDLIGVNVLANPDSIELWQQGYIYTFTYEIRMPTSSVPYPASTLFQFGVATLMPDGESLDRYDALGDVVFTYATTTNFVTYYVSSVVYVDENFTGSSVGNLDEAYTSLEINIQEFNSVTLSVRLSKVKVEKAIGEDAYYQASIDAINDLNSTMNGVNSSVNEVNSSVNEVNQTLEDLPQAQVDAEYEFVYNSMPDSEGEIDVIRGELYDILQMYDDDILAFVGILTSNEARPCLYLPQVSVPFIDVDVWDSHVFYVDDYLNSMNTDIMDRIDYALIFIRLVFGITFATFTVYKFSRIEWWY